MSRNYLIELQPVKCKCDQIVHTLIRSKEEYEQFLCQSCQENINTISEENLELPLKVEGSETTEQSI